MDKSSTDTAAEAAWSKCSVVINLDLQGKHGNDNLGSCTSTKHPLNLSLPIFRAIIQSPTIVKGGTRMDSRSYWGYVYHESNMPVATQHVCMRNSCKIISARIADVNINGW